MPDVKTAAELEANIKRMVGLQRDDNPSNNSHRKMSPPLQHQQHSDQAAEMSAFKKFVSVINDTFCVPFCVLFKAQLFACFVSSFYVFVNDL